jgi:hypothetical protein
VVRAELLATAVSARSATARMVALFLVMATGWSREGRPWAERR